MELGQAVIIVRIYAFDVYGLFILGFRRVGGKGLLEEAGRQGGKGLLEEAGR